MSRVSEDYNLMKNDWTEVIKAILLVGYLVEMQQYINISPYHDTLGQ